MGELLLLGPIYCLLAFLLITGKRGMVEAQTRADTLARRDPLTGLANRRALVEAIGVHAGRRVGLLMLDVDDFKAHQHRVRPSRRRPGAGRRRGLPARACREGDVAARLGGDEFAVLAPGIDSLGMAALAGRLLARDPRRRHGARQRRVRRRRRRTRTCCCATPTMRSPRPSARGKDRALSYAS